jgi:CRP/FNR family transcriptional regulator
MQNEIEIYRRAIMQLNPKVTNEEWEYFESGFTLQTFKARSFFIEASKKNHQPGFITNGLVRQYYINDQGEDITISFVKEYDYATDYVSLL